ncbi:hypothetical protein GCM10009715_24980 [Paeniglutamicibacter psychrophenolicus]
MRAQRGEGFLGQGLPRFEPVLGAEFVVGQHQLDIGAFRGLLQDLNGFGNNFRTNAITWNDGNIQGFAHDT